MSMEMSLLVSGAGAPFVCKYNVNYCFLTVQTVRKDMQNIRRKINDLEIFSNFCFGIFDQ